MPGRPIEAQLVERWKRQADMVVKAIGRHQELRAVVCELTPERKVSQVYRFVNDPRFWSNLGDHGQERDSES